MFLKIPYDIANVAATDELVTYSSWQVYEEDEDPAAIEKYEKEEDERTLIINYTYIMYNHSPFSKSCLKILIRDVKNSLESRIKV